MIVKIQRLKIFEFFSDALKNQVGIGWLRITSTLQPHEKHLKISFT